MAKKNDPSKDKTSQTNIDPSCPSTSTKILEKTWLNKALNHNHQDKLIKNVMAEKNDADVSKTQVPFSFEGYIAKINITMPLTELIAQSSYKS